MKRSGRQFISSFIGLCLFTISIPLLAHHGTSISYDMAKPFRVKGVVTEFKYANPHPSLFFDVTDDKGNVEHWVSEMGTNVSFLMRAGWTKKRSQEVLQPGAIVTLTVYRSKAGGTSGLVAKIENEKGEEIVQGRPGDRDALIEK